MNNVVKNLGGPEGHSINEGSCSGSRDILYNTNNVFTARMLHGWIDNNFRYMYFPLRSTKPRTQTKESKLTEVILDKEVLKNKLAEYLTLGDGTTYGERLEAIKEKASFGAILALVFDGVKVLEKVVIDLVGITNANKQGQVKRDALVEFIDEAIELKGWFGMLEKFDGMIIGVLIDGLVGIYNTSFLSKWDDKAISFLDDASSFLDKK